MLYMFITITLTRIDAGIVSILASGAEPTAVAAFQYDKDWIIKFPSNTDRRDIGLQEYDYSVCAKACE